VSRRFDCSLVLVVAHSLAGVHGTQAGHNLPCGSTRRHSAVAEILDAGRHLATVIVVHDSGRLYPEAFIFTTTAP
jgi:hypothetical protein